MVWSILFFSIQLGIMVPTDEYFSEGLKPPTRQHSCGKSSLSIGESSIEKCHVPWLRWITRFSGQNVVLNRCPIVEQRFWYIDFLSSLIIYSG